MVNKERVKLLVEALRSGHFKQGHSVLERIGKDGAIKNCCLGVACRVAMANGLEVEARREQDEEGAITKFDSAVGYLPDPVSEWYGFEGENPVVWAGNRQTTATSANDSLELDFERIATGFEATYLKEEE